MTELAGWKIPDGFNFTRDVVEQHAADANMRALSVIGSDGVIERRTFAEIASHAAQWAHLLRGRGHQPDDRVLVALGAPSETMAVTLGALKAGLVAVPCPDNLSATELAVRARRSRAAVLVVDPSRSAKVDEMRGLLDTDPDVLPLDEASHLLRRCRAEAPTETRLAGDPALFLFTSGASREPRGVVHTNAYTYALRSQAGHWLDACRGDIVLCTAVPGEARWIWNVLFGPWSRGAEVVVHTGEVDAAERLELIDVLGVTILCQTPIEHRRLAELDPARTPTPQSLRHLVSTGEPLGAEVRDRLREDRGLTIHDGYGQTEGAILLAGTPKQPAVDGTLGYPTPGHEVAVIDADGKPADTGAEGDIALRGRPSSLFIGYLGAPEAAAAASRGDWYVTGDRGTCDESGMIRFAGRTDDVIVSGRRRVRAFEVEHELFAHPAVLDVAVVGRPDDALGEVPKAFVVVRPGCESMVGLAGELGEHASRTDAARGCDVEAEVVAELPRTATGKIRRLELRRRELELAGLSARPDRPGRPQLRAVEGGATGTGGDLHLDTPWSDWQDVAVAPLAVAGAAPTADKADRQTEEARQRAETRERKRREESDRQAAEQVRRAEREAAQTEKARLEAEAKEQQRSAKAQRRAENGARRAEAAKHKAEASRLRAEAKERARQEEAEQKAEQARRRAEADERKRAEEEVRAAEQRLLRAEEAERARIADAERREAQARLDAEAAERERAEEAERRARKESQVAEKERLRAEAEEHKRAEQARRDAEKEARRLEAEQRKAEETRLRAEAEEHKRVEQARRDAEKEARRLEAEQRKAEETRLRAEAEEHKRVEQARRDAEKEARRLEAEQRKAEETRLRAEAEEHKRAEQARRDAEKEARRLEAEQRKAEETRLRAEAEEHKRVEQARRDAEKEARRLEAEQRKAEETRLRAEAEELKRTEAAERRAAAEAKRAAEGRQRAEAKEQLRQAERQSEAERLRTEQHTREEEANRAAEKEARKADVERQRAETEERVRQEQADREAEEARLRAEVEERMHAEETARSAAEERQRTEEDARRQADEATRADERRLRAEAEERARLEEAQRRADDDARRAETARLQAETAAQAAAEAERRRQIETAHRELEQAERGRRRGRPRPAPRRAPTTDDEESEFGDVLVDRLQAYGVHVSSPERDED